MITRLLKTVCAPLLLLTACMLPFNSDSSPDVDYVPGPGVVQHVTVRRLVFDVNMSPSQQEGMIEAAHAWEIAVSGECGLHFEPTVAPVVPGLPEPGVITVRIGDTGGYAGWTEWTSNQAQIIMEPWLDAESFVYVAKHELGHALTLGHVGDGIMIGGPAITAGDANMVCQQLDPQASAALAVATVHACRTTALVR